MLRPTHLKVERRRVQLPPSGYLRSGLSSRICVTNPSGCCGEFPNTPNIRGLSGVTIESKHTLMPAPATVGDPECNTDPGNCCPSGSGVSTRCCIGNAPTTLYLTVFQGPHISDQLATWYKTPLELYGPLTDFDGGGFTVGFDYEGVYPTRYLEGTYTLNYKGYFSGSPYGDLWESDEVTMWGGVTGHYLGSASYPYPVKKAPDFAPIPPGISRSLVFRLWCFSNIVGVPPKFGLQVIPGPNCYIPFSPQTTAMDPEMVTPFECGDISLHSHNAITGNNIIVLYARTTWNESYDFYVTA